MSKSSDWARNLQPIEPGPEHHVITDLAARLAKAERERDDIAFEIVVLRGQFKAQQQHDGALIASLRAKVEHLTRALEEAERVTKPFASEAADWDAIANGGFTFQDQLKIDGCTDLTVGHLRAARKWMEERHD